MAAGRRRVVIVGGGFGGLAAAHKLRRADVDVTLVDRMHHHLFQPLLYQAACGVLSPAEAATPIRSTLKHSRNATVLMAEATGLDAEARQLTLDRGERLDYDSLIVACGARTSYFGNDQWSEVSYGLKTLEDVVALRDRIYGSFEEAERAQDEEARRNWMTFVVVGGGPTGVEVAGALAILRRHDLKRNFARIDPREARVILLDAGERVTAAFSERLSAKVASELSDLGVEIREGARVTAIDDAGVTMTVGGGQEQIAARTVVWAAGVQAAPFAAIVAEATGAPTDRGGHILVAPDLTVPGHPEISVIGDVASVPGPGDRPVPGLATAAIQQARHVAKAIRAGAPGATEPFTYFDKGALAVVGRGKAVCAVRGREVTGRIAFWMYLSVHLYYLAGGGPGHRLKVLIDWLSARYGSLQYQVIHGDLASVERTPP